jgi:pimeloyl-ACP methyl ester carboxylesterase
MAGLDRRLPRPGADIAFCETSGAGEAVVLTHGAGMDSATFDAQAAALEHRGFRVVRWDLRGHGGSTLADGVRFTAVDAVQDLEALLDACGIVRAALVGHSLGGNLVQAFVRRHPERVNGAIVLDATWNDGPLSAPERLALRLAAPALSLIPATRLPRILARASAMTPDAVRRIEATFSRMPKPRFVDVWAATASLVVPDPGRRSPVPLALVRGAEDRTGNIATAMPRWAAAEGVTEHVVASAGHVVTWDAPEATSRILIDVLEGRRA